LKLTAIRLKEVGRFREPVALEGLTGGLDVLAGPNELGKSTILKAVRLALFEQYKSKARKLEAFRPYSGGAPLVEVDFEIDGRPWRVRKQFLASASAELKDLSAGTVTRGPDAEGRLAELLPGDGRFPLLWVEQGAPLAPVEPVKTAGGALNTAIESEVDTVSDGGLARNVEAQLKAELAELVTPGRGQATGRYKEAREECARLERERDAARDRLERAQQRLDELETLRGQIAGLSDPAAAAQRVQAAEDAAKAFAEARAAREQCRRAEEAVRAQEQTAAALTANLGELRNRIADLAKLEEAEGRAAPELAERERQARECKVALDAAQTGREEIRAALVAAEQERKALELAARYDAVEKRLAGARRAAEVCKSVSAAVAANGAEEDMLKAVRREANAAATIAARLSAAAPTVTIAYAKGGAGKLKTGGRALDDGETLNPTSLLAIEIEGIGTITVAPGQGEGVADDAADLAAHEQQLAELLQRAGASSVEDAETRAAERRALETELAAAKHDLKSAAPEGIEHLERAHAQLAGAVPKADAPSRTPEDLETAARELQERLEEAEAHLNEAAKAHTQAREALVQLTAQVEGWRQRIAALTASLGDAEARNAAQDKQAAALAEAEAARNRAVRELAAWQEKAPDEDRVAALKLAAETAKAAHTRAEQQLTELHRTEAGIEGQLMADRADDVQSRVAELDEAHAVAAARQSALAEEAAALQLLAQEIDAAQTETRDRFTKPVLDRLGPYLGLVFPDARARFGDGLTLEALERADSTEQIERLSEGTREQLSVLVRLGLGRLLAETGAPAPLILDDALVYADDERIERMFEALKLAAQSHQVLVLTCRQRSFEGLGGNRVEIGPWRPE
jgi:AAA domain